MNKTAKIISIVLTLIITLSVSISALITTVAAETVTFSLNKVSESSSTCVVSVNLESGSFNNASFEITVSDKIKGCIQISKGKALQDSSAMAVVNADSCKAVITSVTELSQKGEYFVFYFEKATNAQIVASDINLVEKDIDAEIVNNIQEIELHKLYSPNIALSKAKIEDNAKNQSRAKIIETINSMFFQGIMSPSWYGDIDLWFKKYGFEEDVMLALFRYCFEKSALHKNYVSTVAEAWYSNNIKTFDDLDEYFENQEKLNKIKKNISKKLGLTRKLTQYEEAYIEKWICEYNYSFDVIEIALKKTTSKTNPNFDYLDKMISDWKDRNLSSADDVKTYLLNFKNKTKKVQELQKKTNYNNYEQRNITNFDDLYANKQ